MPGKRSSENGSFVTQRALYRRDVSEVEVVTDPDIPILDTLASGYGNQVENNDVNMYGRNAQLDLAVIVASAGGTLQLWMKAEIETEELSDPDAVESSSSSGDDTALELPATEDWVFVEEKAFTRSELWIVKDVPPGKFKVIMIANTGVIHILEQHAA